jgi:ribonuclease HI
VWTEYRVTAGLFACSMTTEETGLIEGLRILVERGLRDVRIKILLDSKSVIELLRSGPAHRLQDTTLTVFQLLAQLVDRGCTIQFQHVFSHCGLEYNEMADKLADEGAALAPSNIVSPRDVEYIIALHRKEVAHTGDEQERKRIKGERAKMETRRREVAAAQIRTTTLPDFGEFRATIAESAQQMPCRYCDPAYMAWAAGARKLKSNEPQQCPVCQSTLSTRAKLQSHMAAKHPTVHHADPVVPAVATTTPETLDHIFQCQKAKQLVQQSTPIDSIVDKVDFIEKLRDLEKTRKSALKSVWKPP